MIHKSILKSDFGIESCEYWTSQFPKEKFLAQTELRWRTEVQRFLETLTKFKGKFTFSNTKNTSGFRISNQSHFSEGKHF